MVIPRRFAPLAAHLVAAIFAVACGAQRSSAQTFDIHAPEAKSGELEFESLNATNVGSLRAMREPTREGHEHKLAYGVTDFWKMEVGALVDRPAGGDLRLSLIEFENIFVLRSVERSGLGLGLFTSIQAATDPATTNSVVFGPIVYWKSERLSALANPYIEKTFGQHHEEGIALTYTWRAKYEIDKVLAVGLQGLGRVENVGNAAPFSAQDHRMGPALYFTREFGNGQDLEIAIGAFAGITHGAPDATLKLNLSVPLMRK